MLGQGRDRVEHARWGDRTRSVDALCSYWAGAPEIGVLVEQVQRPPVVGDLLGAVGSYDDPDGTLVNAGPGFRSPGGEDRWPGNGAGPLTGALAAPAMASRGAPPPTVVGA